VLLSWVWTHQTVLNFAPNRTQYFNFFSLIYFYFWSFLYCTKIEWWYFFHLRLGWISLLKHVCFCVLKIHLKKFKFFFLFNFFPFLLCNFFFIWQRENKLMRLFLYYTKVGWWYFFFSFEIGLNFLIKACLFLRLKNGSTLTMVANVVYA